MQDSFREKLMRMRLPEPFMKPIAHRGLHGPPGTGAIENTMAAFRAAREKGFGIECDIRPARHGLPVVFHDADLDRLVRASIRACAAPTLSLPRPKARAIMAR